MLPSPFLLLLFFVTSLFWTHRVYEMPVVANALQTVLAGIRSQQPGSIGDIWGMVQRNRYWMRRYARLKDDDDKNENENENLSQPPLPGMVDAFRQLESLKSLDDPEEYIPAPQKINVDAVLAETNTLLSSSTTIIPTSSSTTVSLEQDFAVYKDMLQEIEEEESAVSYTEVLDELGGSTLQTDDTYSQIITELGGTKQSNPLPSSLSASSSFSSWVTTTKSIPTTDEVVVNQTTKSDGGTNISNEKLLEDALKEALKEVQLNHNYNPQLHERSILNDKDMMTEIESIFDRGNAQLFESLEDIRREQVTSIWILFCKCIRLLSSHASNTVLHPFLNRKKNQQQQVLAEFKSRTNTPNDNEQDANQNDTIRRLQNAERSIETILKRVDVETSNLEKAVEDLNAANRQMEMNFIWKLKRGGLPKQAALAGLLLFSVRSILESITAVSSVTAIDSETHLYAALVQGVIAMICAVIFFLL
jgi:hypothetical protein